MIWSSYLISREDEVSLSFNILLSMLAWVKRFALDALAQN